MKWAFPLRSSYLVALALALVAGAAQAGEATVTFVHPEGFVDLPMHPAAREQVLHDVAEHFIKLARRLPADQELKVEVLALDLAGRTRPRPGHLDEYRFVGPVDWPTMRVRYRVLAQGQVREQGEEVVSDMSTLYSANHYFSNDPLRFEKTMIDHWFKERVAGR
jgi:hypothetical protein